VLCVGEYIDGGGCGQAGELGLGAVVGVTLTQGLSFPNGKHRRTFPSSRSPFICFVAQDRPHFFHLRLAARGETK
jgi:hypothetical protein